MEGALPESSPTILIIEDDAASRTLLESILTRLGGAKLLSAANGVAGIALASEHEPDLVLLDLHLPDIDGAEVLRRLRSSEHLASVPVVVVTSDATTTARQRVVEAGATTVLTKPLEVGGVIEIVERLLHAVSGRPSPSGGAYASDPAETLFAVFQASPLAIVAIDTDARVTMWNGAAERIFGWSAGEVLGGSLPHVGHEEMERLDGILPRLAAGELVSGEQVTRRRKDGATVELSVSYAPVRDCAGEIVGFMSIAEDISSLRKAEAEALARNRELAALQGTAVALVGARSVDEALRAIITEASTLLDAPFGYIYLFDERSQMLTAEIGHGGGAAFVGSRLRPGEGHAGRVFELGETVVVDDYGQWRGRSRAYDDAGLRTVAALPLRTHEAIVGVLGIGYYEQRSLGTDLELLERFGHLASLALENARLNDGIRERADDLADLLDREQEVSAALAAVVDSSPLSIVATDLDLRVTMWSAAAERIFGWRADETLGGLPPHVPQEELHAPNGPHERSLAGQRTTISDAVRHRKDGSTLDARVFLAPVRDRSGAVTGLMGLTQDVTEQKRAEHELRRSRERLSLALEAAAMGMWERDTGDLDPTWSPELERLYGLEPGTFDGRQESFLALVHEDDRERVEATIHEASMPGSDLVLEFRIVRPDGALRWLLSRGTTVEQADGGRILLGVTADITEQKRVEEELMTAEERYRTLVEQIPAVTYIELVDPAGRTLYVSPQLEDLLGISPEEWLGGGLDVWLDCIHPEDRGEARNAYLTSLVNGAEYDCVYRTVSRDGTLRWFRDRARVVADNNGGPPLVHGVMLDITDQELAQKRVESSLGELRVVDEQRRVLLNRLVRAQEEERQRIATDIHDDSVQVLTALALRLELVRDRVAEPELGATLDDAVDTARRAIGRLRRLTFELRPPALDRDGLASVLRTLLRQIHEEHGLETALHDQLDAQPDSAVSSILYRILQEALANVVRHARATSVTVVLAADGDGFSATVVDDGDGFDADAFVQQPGHIGLSSMRERAEMAGGRYLLRSSPGTGSTVEVFIPGGSAP